MRARKHTWQQKVAEERSHLEDILGRQNRSFEEYLELFPGACHNCGGRRFRRFWGTLETSQNTDPGLCQWLKCTRCGSSGRIDKDMATAWNREEPSCLDRTWVWWAWPARTLSRFLARAQKRRARAIPEWSYHGSGFLTVGTKRVQDRWGDLLSEYE